MASNRIYKSKYTGSQVDALLDKINNLSNPLTLKGRVDTIQDLQNIPDPQPGWMYMVGLSTDTEFPEYFYTDDGVWEYMGVANISVDGTITQDSQNPVTSAAIYTALEGKQDALGQTQLAAVNSGITSTDVTQIGTNKNNILSEQAKTTGMTEGGSNYITVGGIRVYVSATAPTGNIPDGSVGVGW